MKTIAFTQISPKRTGGNAWVQEVIEAVSSKRDSFSVETIDLSAKRFKKIKFLNALEVFFNLLTLRGERDLWIRNFYSIVFLNKKRTKGKNVAFIFHIDFSGFPWFLRPFLVFLEKFIFYRQLRRADVIVVVSEYWKKHFVDKGYKNVEKIYFEIDPSDFIVSDEEVSEFKEKYNLKNKPIIYLGNCQKAKGVIDSYNALKDLDAYFVTSGKKEIDIPALNLDLSLREYFILLKASTIVLTMSKFKEGWCRTTYEAMILKTPVIGSGAGGMRELLDGGRQMVCENFRNLKEKAEILLKDENLRKKMGQDGYDYTKEFTKERFKKAWIDLIEKTLNV
jgi:glycosyltransferase involved in cell wall biosynthesis